MKEIKNANEEMKNDLKCNIWHYIRIIAGHSPFLHITLTFLISQYSFLNSAAQTSDSLILQTLRQHDICFSSNNSVSLLMSGQQKFDDMFHAIRQAKSSIHLEYFNFRNDSIASELFNILREKSREGVEVRAMFDGFGNDSNNQPLKKYHLKALREDGIDIVEYSPIRFPWVNHIYGRDHRKIVVIDGRVGYTGGMNVADYYIKGTKQVGEWRDMHCRIEGDAVNELQHIFLRIWNRTTGQHVSGMKYFNGGTLTRFNGLKPDTTSTSGHKLVGIITREPHVTPKIMRTFYVNAIDEAQDSIHIINPYFTLIPSVTKALTRALRRGVKVEIMLSAKSDVPLTPDVVFYQGHKLMKRGAKVWLYQPGFHHSKIMMVDGRFCTVGSTNLDARSLKCDFEENAVIIDKSTTRELDDMFLRDKQKSILLTPAYWNEFRTPWQKFRGCLAHHLLQVFL
jgi:cardiolipin synthase